MEPIAHDTGPPGTYFVVLTFAGGRQEYFNHIETRDEAVQHGAELYRDRLSGGLLAYAVEIRMNVPTAYGTGGGAASLGEPGEPAG
jgi:hypothetical protein